MILLRLPLIFLLLFLGSSIAADQQNLSNCEASELLDELLGLNRDLEDPDTQYTLGERHYEGVCGVKDTAEGIRWFILAAEQGHVDAQYSLGGIYFFGASAIQDYASAEKWWRKAAAQGHVDAQNNLGVMYQYGSGVLESNLIAHMWYNIAQANGSERSRKFRDELSIKMTPADISEAQAMARVCMKSGYSDCGW